MSSSHVKCAILTSVLVWLQNVGGELNLDNNQTTFTSISTPPLDSENDTDMLPCHLNSSCSVTPASLYMPSIISQPSGVLELPLGATFEVVCEAKGIPLPAITWRNNGVVIDKHLSRANRQSHIFEIKSRLMSGPIECVATNDVGPPAMAGVYLNVLFLPEVTVPQTVVYSMVGARAHLECKVEAAPAATLKWYHHGVPVQMGPHFSNLDRELQANLSIYNYVSYMKHVLVLKKVREEDMGHYECRASNSLGFKSATIELTGRPMPCVFRINPSLQSSTSHGLVWQTESMLPITEFKLKFRQIPSGNLTKQSRTNWTELTIPAQATNGPVYITSYTLHGLQPASLFEVCVLAKNSFGWSDNSKTVRFATGGEVELPNYSTESEMRYDSTEDDFDNEITQRTHLLSASMIHNHAAITSTSVEISWIFSIILICQQLR